MTLLARTTNRATRLNRHRQMLAETRMDEIVSVAGIADDYDKLDKPGDIEIKAAFANVYRLMDDDEEREAVAAAFATWLRHDQRKDVHVRGATDDAVTTLKTNNPIWLNGAAVPGESDGAA